MSEQPEALRLADAITHPEGEPTWETCVKAAAELRRLHEVNQELLKALNKIATVNAMDYEYQAWARAAIAKAEGETK